MAIIFPPSPVQDDEFTANGKVWIYDDSIWKQKALTYELNDLTDVSTSGITDTNVLKTNGSTWSPDIESNTTRPSREGAGLGYLFFIRCEVAGSNSGDNGDGTANFTDIDECFDFANTLETDGIEIYLVGTHYPTRGVTIKNNAMWYIAGNRTTTIIDGTNISATWGSNSTPAAWIWDNYFFGLFNATVWFGDLEFHNIPLPLFASGSNIWFGDDFVVEDADGSETLFFHGCNMVNYGYIQLYCPVGNSVTTAIYMYDSTMDNDGTVDVGKTYGNQYTTTSRFGLGLEMYFNSKWMQDGSLYVLATKGGINMGENSTFNSHGITELYREDTATSNGSTGIEMFSGCTMTITNYLEVGSYGDSTYKWWKGILVGENSKLYGASGNLYYTINDIDSEVYNGSSCSASS